MLKFIQQSLKVVVHHEVIHSVCSHGLVEMCIPSLISILQLLCPLLELLMSWCDETHPDPVRAAIAGLLGRNWDIWCKMTMSANLAVLFWQMSVALLQDVEEEVREEMCTSLQDMLGTLTSHAKSSGMIVNPMHTHMGCSFSLVQETT